MDTIEKMESALGLFNAGDLAGAEIACRAVLEEELDNPDAYYVLGLVELKRGNHDDADLHLQKAIDLEPNAPFFFVALAEVQSARGKLTDAVESLRRSLVLNPDQPQLFEAAARILNQLGRHDEHIQLWQAFTRVAPDNATAFHNLGTTLLRLHRASQAVPAFQRAIALDPNHVDAYAGLAMALAETSQREPAIDAARRALVLAPEHAFTHFTAGVVYDSFKMIDEAIEQYEQTLQRAPGSAEATEKLATLYAETGEIAAACAQLDAASRAGRRGFAQDSLRLSLMNYFPQASTQEIFEAHKRWGTDVAEPYLAEARSHGNTPEPNRTLRIGYISGYMHYHAAGLFLRPILQNHHDDRFEPVCFSDTRLPDEMTAALEDLSEGWHATAGKGVTEIVELIRHEAIDILIDLGGHSDGPLLEVAAFKPAPLVVSYLGYCNTTGMRAVDYIVGDAITDPPENTQPYVESVLRLPGCMACYGPLQSSPMVNESPAISRGRITFGACHAPQNLNEKVLDAWSSILKEIPSATLLLSHEMLTPRVQTRLRGEFQRRGIAADRLVMRSDPPRAGDRMNLSVYHEIDIALDAFPYSGLASACNAMWMGVPCVTLRGNSHAGRMSASAITHAGFGQFVANSPEEYVTIAKSLAVPDSLKPLRASMRGRVQESSLCDGDKFTIGWENALRSAWRAWCSMRTPRR